MPLLPGTLALAEAGVIPSGTRSNHAFVSPNTAWGDLPEAEQLVLADAQTSGGLLIAVSAERAPALRELLSKRGVIAAEIGAVEDGAPGHVDIRGRVAR